MLYIRTSLIFGHFVYTFLYKLLSYKKKSVYTIINLSLTVWNVSQADRRWWPLRDDILNLNKILWCPSKILSPKSSNWPKEIWRLKMLWWIRDISNTVDGFGGSLEMTNASLVVKLSKRLLWKLLLKCLIRFWWLEAVKCSATVLQTYIMVGCVRIFVAIVWFDI